MKYIKLIQSKKIFWVIGVVLTIFALASLYTFKLSLGPEYRDAWVVEIMVGEEIDVQEVTSIVKDNYQSPTKVDWDSSNTFYIYFQNINLDELANIEETISDNISNINELNVYSHSPERIFAVEDRVVNLLSITTAAVMLYLILTFKGKGMNYLQTLSVVLSDVLIILWGTGVTLGFAAMLGEFGLVMDKWFLAFMMMIIDVFLINMVFDDLRFVDFAQNHKLNEVNTVLFKMIEKDWPTNVLVATVSTFIFIFPFVLFGMPLMWGAPIMLVVTLLCLYSVFACKYYTLRILEMTLTKLDKIKELLNKQW